MVVARAGSKSAVWVLAVALAASGCGYDDPLPTPTSPVAPPPVPPSQAEIALSINPTPIDAVAAAEGAPWFSEWTVEVRETAGLGGTIDFVRATLTDASGKSLGETELDVDDVTAQIGSPQLRGASLQRLEMSLAFEFPTDVISGDLQVTLQLTDDRGNIVSAEVEDVIRVCIPVLLAPPAGTPFDNGCASRENGILWEFDWSECAGAESYHLYVELRGAPNPTVDRASLTSSTFTLLENRFIPEENRFGWFWKVQAQLNGVWGDFSPDQDFEVEPLNTDCVTP